MSVIKADTWLNLDGTENYKCRAWVNFDGTGTVAIIASGNVSSVVDNGVGQYDVNFITAMPDADYTMAGGAEFTVSDVNVNKTTGPALVGSFPALTRNSAGLVDPTLVYCVFHR